MPRGWLAGGVNVYLDHAATAPVLPEAAAAYAEALGRVGNPSSIHADGRAARALLEDARERVAAVADAHPTEVVFTSGGTESVNIAVKGLLWAAGEGRDRVLVSPAEHRATLDAAEWLAARGAQVDLVPVDGVGRVVVPELARIIEAGGTRAVAVLSLLWANNEIGTIEDVDAVADLAAEVGAPLHWDAVAAFGHVPISFRRSGATALSISGHKFGAPIGTGAILVRRGAVPEALVHGGAQQAARSGTMDVAGAVALAVAAESAAAAMASEERRLRALSGRLARAIEREVPDAVLTGDAEGRLSGLVHATFPGLLGETLLFVLDQAGYSVSVGSACRAGVAEPSHVLIAIGLDAAAASSALRVSLGRTTTEADVDGFIAALPAAVAAARTAF